MWPLIGRQVRELRRETARPWSAPVAITSQSASPRSLTASRPKGHPGRLGRARAGRPAPARGSSRQSSRISSASSSFGDKPGRQVSASALRGRSVAAQAQPRRSRPPTIASQASVADRQRRRTGPARRPPAPPAPARGCAPPAAGRGRRGRPASSTASNTGASMPAATPEAPARRSGVADGHDAAGVGQRQRRAQPQRARARHDDLRAFAAHGSNDPHGPRKSRAPPRRRPWPYSAAMLTGGRGP